MTEAPVLGPGSARDTRSSERTSPGDALESREALWIGNVRVGGRVLAAPMTGVTDLPFRRTLARQGSAYVATEMVACAELAGGQPDVVRRAAVGDDLPLTVVQLVGREARWLGAGAKLAEAAGAEIIDINMGCPAKAVTGLLAGSALMRNLDQAVALIAAAVEAVRVPVTLKMRLGWDAASQNAPDLAARAEAVGIQAFTVHARTRCQFYSGAADWDAVAAVKEAVGVPVIVNGDIVDEATAREALARSGADGVMVGRGMYGRPWATAKIAAELANRAAPEPSPETRLALALDHMGDALSFYGDALGLRTFRKHLGWYVEHAPYPHNPQARRAAKSSLCRLETAGEVETALTRLWLGSAQTRS